MTKRDTLPATSLLACGYHDFTGRPPVELAVIEPVSPDAEMLERVRLVFGLTRQSVLIEMVTEAGFAHAGQMGRTELLERLAVHASKGIR